MATTESVQAQNAPAVSTSRRGGSIALVIICAAVFLTALDQTVVVTALTPIADGFGLPIQQTLSQLSWVVSGYLLGYVIVMPLMGRVSDIYGRRRVLLACLGLFAFGSLLCAESIALSGLWQLDFFHLPAGNSSALTWLIIARFLQAVGGGAVVPVAIASIGDLYGSRQRILALGLIGGVTEAGGALGPLYGALFLQRWGYHLVGVDQNWSLHPLTFDQNWQWIFLINLPIVAVIILALLFLWPRNALGTAAATPQRGIDWIGSLLLGGSLLCLSLGLGQQAGALTSLSHAQAVQNNPLLVLAALVLLVGFVVFELFRRNPLIDPRIFRQSAAFSASAVFSLLLGSALIIALVDVPLYVFNATSPSNYLDAGLALLRMTVMIPIGAFGGGWLVARFGTRPIGAIGAAATSLGFFIMHTWTTQINWTTLTIGAVIAGTGFGLIVAPLSTTALNTTSAERFGMASSVVTALRIVGMILGLAALSSWGVGRYQYLTSQVKVPPDITDVTQLQNYITNQATQIVNNIVTDFFLVGAIIALLAIIPALLLWRPKPGAAGQKEGEVAVFSMGL